MESQQEKIGSDGQIEDFLRVHAEDHYFHELATK